MGVQLGRLVRPLFSGKVTDMKERVHANPAAIEIRSKMSGNLVSSFRLDGDRNIETVIKQAGIERDRWNASEQFPEGVYLSIPLADK